MLDSLRTYLGERPLIEELGPVSRRSARHAYQGRFAAALAIAAGLHVSLTAAGILLRFEGRSGTEARLIGCPIIFTHAPIAIRERPEAPKPPAGGSGAPVFKALTAGIPIPVPSSEAESETIRPAEQNEIEGATLVHRLGDESLSGGGGEGEGPGGLAVESIPDRPDPGTFQYVEKEPQLVDGGAPVYPELARLSKIEGTVLVRALVGADGKVREVIVLKAVNDLLDQAAAAATMGYVFLPAMQNGRPVAVWVTIPFRFSLR
jgi:protein TonB